MDCEFNKFPRPDAEDLKCDINNFLWEKSPSGVTLIEMDDLAVYIWTQMEQWWDKQNKKDGESK